MSETKALTVYGNLLTGSGSGGAGRLGEAEGGGTCGVRSWIAWQRF